MRRAAKEKECRALMVSRLRHNSASSRSSGRKVARLPQPIKARPTDSRKVEKKKQKNQHPRRGHNNFGAITPAAPDVKLRSRFFLTLPLVGRLCQTPIVDLFVIGKTFLIWPLFPVRGQTSSNRILSNVIPLFWIDSDVRRRRSKPPGCHRHFSRAPYDSLNQRLNHFRKAATLSSRSSGAVSK